MAHGFSIRTAYPQEAGVICCAGLSIVAGVARRQSGRSRHQDRPPARFEGTAWRISYVGHATFLIQTAGLNILLDPVWSKRANLKIS
jgi:Beta-lactamase superfamily domain